MLTLIIAAAAAQSLNSPCLGSPVRECLRHLRSFLAFKMDEASADRVIEKAYERDVTGKPLTRYPMISLNATLRGQHGAPRDDYLPIRLKLDGQRRVQSITFFLPKDPSLANTAAEYDDTSIYSYASLIGQTITCPVLSDKLAFYRYFQASVKALIHRGSPTFDIGSSYARKESHDSSGYVRFCGFRMVYDLFRGSDTSMIGDGSATGSFFDPALTFSR